MFRTIASRFSAQITAVTRSSISKQNAIAGVRSYSAHVEESDEEFDSRYVGYFNNPQIDGWTIRKGMNDLQGYDLVPEPRIISAALKACRRINDIALAVRFLEAVQDKCGSKKSEIWPYIHQEIKPTLDELGIPTPEMLGYDKPELAVEDVYDMH